MLSNRYHKKIAGDDAKKSKRSPLKRGPFWGLCPRTPPFQYYFRGKGCQGLERGPLVAHDTHIFVRVLFTQGRVFRVCVQMGGFLMFGGC